MSQNAIPQLLSNISNLSLSYEKIARLTGENFNIFKILGVETREVKLHSAFIAALLNPKGDHSLGNVFAVEFEKVLSKKLEGKEQSNFNFEKIKSSEVEFYLGPIKNEIEGGSIDILLGDEDGKRFIIENKIYAVDQKNQLLRYHNSFPDSMIIYLTLYGHKPAENYEFFKDRLIFFSYKNDIIEWLENCKKHAVDHPILRETIAQYINQIKKLTNQTTNHHMEQEVINTLNSNLVNFNAAEVISNNFYKAQEELKKKLNTAVDTAPNFLAHYGEDGKKNFIEWRNIRIIFEVAFDWDPNEIALSELHIGLKALPINCEGKVDPCALLDEDTKENADILINILQEKLGNKYGAKLLVKLRNFWPIMIESQYGKDFKAFSNDTKKMIFDENKRKELAYNIVEEAILFSNEVKEILNKE